MIALLLVVSVGSAIAITGSAITTPIFQFASCPQEHTTTTTIMATLGNGSVVSEQAITGFRMGPCPGTDLLFPIIVIIVVGTLISLAITIERKKH